MPTARINDKGTEIYYEDTGSVAGVNNYSTVILLHGIGYNGG
jgi:hypothetical protein